MTTLVTGGTGFVAGWCIAELLDRGHTVRTTVRDARRAAQVRAVAGDRGEELEVVVADLMCDDGWAAAVDGCEQVLHVASPMGEGAEPKDPDVLIRLAREGTLRVLRAAVEAAVPRVVMTSSCAAATPRPGTDGEFDETLWTDPDQRGLDTYRRSKAIAERAAWDFMAERGGATTLTTVLPGAVFGPVRSAGTTGSVDVIGRMLRGMPGVPRIGLTSSMCGISPTCTSAPRPTRRLRESDSSPSATSCGCRRWPTSFGPGSARPRSACRGGPCPTPRCG